MVINREGHCVVNVAVGEPLPSPRSWRFILRRPRIRVHPPMDRALGATIIPVREKFHMLVLYVLTETTNFPRCHAEMPIWLSSNDLRNMPSWEGSALRAVYEPRGRVKLV